MKSILTKIVSTILAAMISVSLFAQQKDVVSGTITSANGEPLVGASVVVKGSVARGAITDINGAYSIPASSGEITLKGEFKVLLSTL